MENRERAARSREDFRRLPPRVTPEQMIPVQPVLHLLHDPRPGTDTEWRLWTGSAG